MSADYVVVGAGTAGCVIARELIERGRKVTLIEAGGSDRHPFVRIPAAFPKLFKSSRDWAYQTEPQAGLEGRRIFWPRGKMLGGSSSMNAQIHQWCSAEDFASWERLGASGWGPDGMTEALAKVDPDMNGGPLRDPSELTLAFLEAAAAAGLPQDQQRGRAGLRPGSWLCDVAHRNGRRWSAADAFLRPAMRRRELSLLRHRVRRIAFDGHRAVGVVVMERGRERTITARDGVIVAAGAINSPQLLLLSGIGPADQLQPLGIETLVHSPDVGRNLQDHLMAVTHHRIAQPISLKAAERPRSLLRYIFRRRGMMASNIAEAIAFAPSSPDGPVDLELVFAPALFENEGLTPPSAHGLSIAAVLLKPRSRGSIRLASADPAAAPLIDAGYLSDPEGHDLDRMVAGMALAHSISTRDPLSRYITGSILPGKWDPESVRAAVRSTAHTIYHPVGTCRVGSDTASVVDSKLAVRGTEALWVADASVIPEIPSGHPNAIVAALAYRFAGLLAGD